ncbi:MAG: GTP pyrophosphokinase, partial [Tissierellia bacterium]|nr:GTP pyrophosphokinase [Tissierellia bacterium]
MKLELFDFIDETLSLIDTKKDDIRDASDEILELLQDIFSGCDHIININHRLKSADSLREKILRHNFYLHYGT